MSLLHHFTALSILFFSSTFGTYAQQATAEFNPLNGKITLPESGSLEDSYLIDLSDFAFESEVEAMEYFREQSGDFHFFRPLVSQNKAVLYLQRNKQSDWTASDWNSYLEDKHLPLDGKKQSEETISE